MKIKICLGTCCHLLGNYEIIEKLEERGLNNKKNIEIIAATCLNYCKDAELKPPFIEIDGQIIQNATIDAVVSYLNENSETN
ncbi:MAG TPA: (2Fe-2S) ferredoxin domain-containing protein [bacterium]|nr:(2Fe-2S) ferredoxin domain-containing protein [bacterium]